MSKEEIMSECDNLEGYLYAADVSDAMDKYAEKVAVAFAEWKDKNVYRSSLDGIEYRLINSPEISFETTSDLYQYWIENVYNK